VASFIYNDGAIRAMLIIPAILPVIRVASGLHFPSNFLRFTFL